LRKELDAKSLVRAIRTAAGRPTGGIALHEPCISGNAWTYVKDCLDSNWVSYLGRYVDKFESMIADFTGVKKVVAVVNGTAALQISLKLAGVGIGDEVLVPALTFVATANAVAHCGAIPHFVDSEAPTLGMDPEKLDSYLEKIAARDSHGCVSRITGRRIRTAVPMHTFGHPVNLDKLMDVCKKHDIALVEDAAESLGSFYKGKHTGNWGKLSILSFNGNKTITTGGGGAILTNDEALGQMAKHLTSTAKVPHPWEYSHDQIGYNYRMSNINAALGCAQMEELSRFLEQKRDLAARYQSALKDIEGLRFFTEPPDSRSNYWLNTILIDETDITTRNELLKTLHESGVMARPAWTLLHKLPMFSECPRMDLSCAEELEARIISLPSSPILVEKRKLR